MIESSGMSARSIQIRLFLTCWIIFVLHFATDFVREHYLVLSIAEDCSFRLDDYVDLHYDIFVTPGHGAHHAGNPGASMVAALPYFVFMPAVNRISNLFSRPRTAEEENAVYHDPIAARVQFYDKVRQRGLDIKFGLVAIVTMVFCMAPLTALSAVFMFRAIKFFGQSNGVSLGLAILYAFGTPVFFRTGYLNHNLMLGIFGFIAFVLIWQGGNEPGSAIQRYAIAGFLAGLAFLCDYSGLITLVLLGAYAARKSANADRAPQTAKLWSWYVLGAAIPVGLLWLYQWSSFGHPFYPPQHFMPAINRYTGLGYKGIVWSGELFWMLLFDSRVGLFIASPILLLSFVSPVLYFRRKSLIPLREIILCLLFFFCFVIFFSCVQYTRLQWITGIRYLIPVVPFLFLLTADVMLQLPRIPAYVLMVIAILQSWCMAMVRPDEGVSVIESVVSVFQKGPQLPWLDTLSRMSHQYIPYLANGVSSLPFFLFGALLVFFVWRVGLEERSLMQAGSPRSS